MEVDKVACMAADKKRDKNWPTWSWTWVADTKVNKVADLVAKKIRWLR